MGDEWVDIVPAQRRAAGEAAYKDWLVARGLTHDDVKADLMMEIGRMVGGGDFVRYKLRSTRLSQLGPSDEV